MLIIARIGEYNSRVYYYEVSPTTIVRAQADVFTYHAEEVLQLGAIVTIPVGTKTLTGVVTRVVDRPSYDTKAITTVVESVPLPSPLLALAAWLSNYYATHPATVWQTVLPRGITKKRRTPPDATPVFKRNRTKNVFTEEQREALRIITDMTPGTALLHGVTGAGKTLVYIEAAKQAVAAGSSVIVLVPEIALTSQLVAEFSQHFPGVVVTHSKQTEAQRHIAWRTVLHHTTPQVIIGPRSALFMPVSKLGLIVVDECHEPSFKQEQSPRYSALRAATVLAQHHQAKVVFGSATPSVADYFLARTSGRPIITMTRPARSAVVKPQLAVVDMTDRSQFSQHHFLSSQLLDAMRRTLSQGNQILLFHNRRGTASITLCTQCGWQAGCPRCFVPLTLHADAHLLRCHICNLTARVMTSCPNCHSADIVHKGIGTKQIETAVSQLFPQSSIARFDGDSASDATVNALYDQLYRGDVSIIIGTQVIAKGLDLPHLRTVGVIQADAGLSLPDFTASERTFQLLAQVAGRVGRSHHPTELIVQSYQPNHPAVQDGLHQHYSDFYKRTLATRRATNFPPFVHLLKLTCSYKTEAAAVRNARTLAAALRNVAGDAVEILGPTPAFYERMRDTYRWQLIIKSPQRRELVALMQHIPSTHWQAELDPMSLL